MSIVQIMISILAWYLLRIGWMLGQYMLISITCHSAQCTLVHPHCSGGVRLYTTVQRLDVNPYGVRTYIKIAAEKST
jgi:hypothetical protein